jgi:hypothetical protein
VVDIAWQWFSYLKDSKAAIEVVLGDARLQLEREPPQQFDVLVIDAFSSDSIPAHLLTREAMQVYLRHLKPDGVIALHVTNRFLDLPPVVRRIADDLGLAAVIVSDEPTERGDSFMSSSDWVLVSRTGKPFEREALRKVAQPVEQRPNWRLWTDSFNNLFQILKKSARVSAAPRACTSERWPARARPATPGQPRSALGPAGTRALAPLRCRCRRSPIAARAARRRPVSRASGVAPAPCGRRPCRRPPPSPSSSPGGPPRDTRRSPRARR